MALSVFGWASLDDSLDPPDKTPPFGDICPGSSV